MLLKPIILKNSFLLLAAQALFFSACAQTSQEHMVLNDTDATTMTNDTSQLDTATFGAGCFWCIEAVFQRLEGVESVTSGYTGGHVKNPGYREVCAGVTGHAEVAQIVYRPAVISYTELLEVFLTTHDPTQLNRQGNDVGTQYRSSIFAHDETQLQTAQKAIKAADSSGLWKKPIVTTVEMIDVFYPAEAEHQNYYDQNANQPYCAYVIAPKIEKLRKVFKDKLKASYK